MNLSVSWMPNSSLLRPSSLQSTPTSTFSSLETKQLMNGNFQPSESSQQPLPSTSLFSYQTSENMHLSIRSSVSQPALPSTTSKTARTQTLSTDSSPNLTMILFSSCKESLIKFILRNSSNKEINWPRLLLCHLSSFCSTSAIQFVPQATTNSQETSSSIQFMRSSR